MSTPSGEAREELVSDLAEVGISFGYVGGPGLGYLEGDVFRRLVAERLHAMGWRRWRRPLSLRCRLRMHKWANHRRVRDDSTATASGGITVISACRAAFTCARCGLDSDEFYGFTTTDEGGQK